jgi:hypothetical protein
MNVVNPNDLVGVQMHDMKKYSLLINKLMEFYVEVREPLLQKLFGKDRGTEIWDQIDSIHADLHSVLRFLKFKEKKILIANIMYNEKLYES